MLRDPIYILLSLYDKKTDNRIMKTKILILFLATMILTLSHLQAQEKNDTIDKKKKKEKPVLLTPYHKNVIKFNPTPMLLFADVRNITFSYERMINKDMSLALQVGYLLFPRVITDTVAHLITLSEGSKKGINLSFDYRYYPFSRNRRPAPDGLYLGGYLSYYGFQFKNNFDILYTTVDQNGSITGKLNVVNLGLELGYQFIFWKRLSLDLLLFGPSLSYYQGNLDIQGNLDEDELANLNQELVDKLLARFPSLKELFSEDGLKFTGNRTNFGLGFRYSIQLGFHF
jgi:hypothetical protein